MKFAQSALRFGPLALFVGMTSGGALGCDGPPALESSGSTESGAGGSLPYEGVPFPNRRAPLVIPPEGLALVANARSDTLSSVGIASGELLATLRVGRDPITNEGPEGIVVHEPSSSVYVVLAYQGVHAALHAKGEVQHTSSAYVQKLSLTDLSVLGEVEIPEEPRGLAMSNDGTHLVTVHFTSPGEVAAQMTPDALESARGRLTWIDTASIETVFSETPHFVTACIGAESVALSGDGNTAFVACFDEDAVAVVDLTQGDLKPVRVAAGPLPGLPGLPIHGPSALAVSVDGSHVFLANTLQRQIRLLSMATISVPETSVFTTEGTPVALTVGDGGSPYVLTRDPAMVIRLSVDLADAMAEQTLAQEECANPKAIAAASASRLVVACAGEEGAAGRILMLDASTLSPLGSVAVGKAPGALAVVAGGKR